MARAEVLIEDAEQGANVRFLFADGFNAESPAHQLTNIIRLKLDEMTQAGELVALPAANEPEQLELVAASE